MLPFRLLPLALLAITAGAANALRADRERLHAATGARRSPAQLSMPRFVAGAPPAAATALREGNAITRAGLT